MDDYTDTEKVMTAKGAILPDTNFSTREIVYRIFFRFKLFIFCSLFVPVLSLVLIHTIPPTYKASSKILIKHNDSVTPYFNEIVTSRKQSISGQSNVEILRSLPICKSVVKKLDLKNSEIARPAYKIIIAQLSRLYFYFKEGAAENDKDTEENEELKITRLAKDFKATISPRIIQKSRDALLVQDELIEVEVKSFSRQKVATITNTLCEAFMEEFYKIYENEASQAYEYLNNQINLMHRQIVADAKEHGKLSRKEWTQRNINTNPIVERIARQVAELEKELFRLKNLYAANSPEVKKAKAEFDAAVERLAEYRASESADAILTVLTEKRRAAYMTIQLYKNRLIPISIIEEAVTPKKSSLIMFMRYGVVGCAGLIAGVMIGFTLVMFFSAIDNRLYTPWDIERNTRLETIGSIRESSKIARAVAEISDQKANPAVNAIMDMLGMLDLMSTEKGQVLLVTSPAVNEGKTTVALQAAMTIAQDKRARTLLIDANFKDPVLSEKFRKKMGNHFEENRNKGMVDVLLGDVTVDEVIQPLGYHNLDIIFSGGAQVRTQVGFYKKSLKEAFNELRNRYDLIVIDSPGLLTSVDAALFASEADNVVLVIRAGLTRLETVKNAIAVLKRSGKEAVGVILNFRKFPVPKIFYG